MEKEIIYFELGSLQPLLDYPDEDPFLSWMGYWSNNASNNAWYPWWKHIKFVLNQVLKTVHLDLKSPQQKIGLIECPKTSSILYDFVVENPEPGEFLEYTEENFWCKGGVFLMEYLLTNIVLEKSSILEELMDNTVLKEIAYGSKFKEPTLEYDNVLIPLICVNEEDPRLYIGQCKIKE